MVARLSRVLLTKTSIANVDEDNRFSAYKNLAVSTLIWEDNIDGEIDITCSDIDFIGDSVVLKIVPNEDGIEVYRYENELPLSVYYMVDASLNKAIEFEEYVFVKRTDIIALLVPDFFPEDLYGGAEALYYIQFV